MFVEILSFPPAPQRPAAEQKELTNKWNEMGTDEPGLKTLPRRSQNQICHFHVCFLSRANAAKAF